MQKHESFHLCIYTERERERESTYPRRIPRGGEFLDVDVALLILFQDNTQGLVQLHHTVHGARLAGSTGLVEIRCHHGRGRAVYYFYMYK